jgi:serine/threonine protein kinase
MKSGNQLAGDQMTEDLRRVEAKRRGVVQWVRSCSSYSLIMQKRLINYALMCSKTTTLQEPGQTLIKASELSYDREIARGNYGTVYKGRCRGFPVAIKLLHNQHLIEPKIEELKREVEIMRCTSYLLFVITL